jgi:CheY-like chemotaxis protein
VELHGGRIDAASDGPGKGSRFTVRLPLATSSPTQEEDGAGAPAPAPQAAARRVLVADDNRDAADTLAMLIEFEGHSVMLAYDGAAALEAFGRFNPDIVLLDLGMPRLSGIEVAQRIRAAESGTHAMLVAITGWGQSGDRARTLAAGFDHHLTKPVDVGRLRELLRAGPAAGRGKPG